MRIRTFIFSVMVWLLFSCTGAPASAEQDIGKGPEFSASKTIKHLRVQWKFGERTSLPGEKVQETYILRLSDAYGRDVRYAGLNQADDRKVRDNYLTFGIENDFYIQLCDQVYPSVGCVPEKTYGLSQDLKLIVTFEVPEGCKEDRILVFDDRHFNVGRTKSTVSYLN